MADLFDEVAAGKLRPVYVLASQQPLLVERAVAAIRDAAVPPAARGFNYDIVEGKGASGAQIVAMAQTLPMMAERRMIYIRDLAPIAAAELSKLVPYFKSPNPTTVLCAAWSKLDKRLGFYKSISKLKVIVELEPPKQIASWVTAEAKRRGIAIDPAARKRLAEVIGNDLARLALSLDQLALYAGNRPGGGRGATDPTIRADDVDDLIADIRERTVWELTDAIGDRDHRAAITAVAALCEQRQSAVGVVALISRHLRQIERCRAAHAQRLRGKDLFAFVGASPYIIKKLERHARNYAAGEIADALVLLASADGALKGMSDATKVLGRELSDRVVLDRLVSQIVSR